MQTNLAAGFRDSPQGQEAEAILRACVHCGFCTATCPTYQLLGDELDGPRGRIYLIKQMLEGQPAGGSTRTHLDRCLTCRSCETTCPSGVRYGRLVDIGREVIEQQSPRPAGQRLLRSLLRRIMPYPGRFSLLLRLAGLFRPLLPPQLRRKLPAAANAGVRPLARHPRRMLVLEGCVQSAATPGTNASVARILDRLGISLVSAAAAGCCGAVSHHLAAAGEALEFVRRNIDAWWPEIEQGAEAILISASGCGVMVKEYGHLLRHDPQYGDKARRISELAKDLVEVLELLDLPAVSQTRRVAFHSPCTLQHGQQLDGRVEAILRRLGYQLTPVRDPHLCCGSAGTYSLLQPQLSRQLLQNKLGALQAHQPELIATANIGCQLHLASAAGVPVVHWVELVEDAFS